MGLFKSKQSALFGANGLNFAVQSGGVSFALKQRQACRGEFACVLLLSLFECGKAGAKLSMSAERGGAIPLQDERLVFELTDAQPLQAIMQLALLLLGVGELIALDAQLLGGLLHPALQLFKR